MLGVAPRAGAALGSRCDPFFLAPTRIAHRFPRRSNSRPPGLLLAGFAFAVVMGMVGGFFPARHAAQLPVVQALR